MRIIFNTADGDIGVASAALRRAMSVPIWKAGIVVMCGRKFYVKKTKTGFSVTEF